ncbi:MAG: beta strand repeat-containing protein, partial [Anaerolineae bacterium]
MDSGSRISLAGMVLLLIGLSLWVGWALSVPAYANPGILYAAPSAQGSGNCSSWADACTLQTALAQATSGDEIWVKRGVHKPTTVSSDRTASFTLKDGVALYGGFLGTEDERDQRNWQTNVTVLSGDIGGDDIVDTSGVVTTTANIRGSNSYHVIYSTGDTSTAILDGFVVTAGQANGAMFQDYGGGMFNDNSDPTVRNVIFSGNAAIQGGGMYNSDSHPTLVNVTFSGNAATQDGGGMYNS